MRKWIIILICAAFLFYKYVLQVYPSVMTEQLMAAFSVEGMGLGNLAASFFWTYLVTQLFVGVLLDRYSTRYLSGFAVLIAALGAFLFPLSNSIVIAMIARGLMGVGAAFATVSYLKMAAVWFKPHQFASISGLLTTAAMVGAVFGQAPLSLLAHSAGWEKSLFLCGFIGIILALAFFLFVRDGKKKNEPHQAVSFKEVKKALCKGENWLLTFYSGLAFAPLAVFGGLWGPPFLRESYGLDPTHAALFVSYSFIGLAVGGPFLGWLSDFLQKRRQVMAFGTTLSLIAITSIIYVPHLPFLLLGLLLFLFGFGLGAFMLAFAIGKEMNPSHMAATIIALINTGDAIFGALTEPAIGWILDKFWGGEMLNGAPYFAVETYKIALVLLPIYLLAALILLFFIKERKVPTEHVVSDFDTQL